MANWFPDGEARKDGCEWCGLMGCDCPPEGPGKVTQRPMVPVCSKCKRAKGADGCHCLSQYRYSEKHEAKDDKGEVPVKPRRPYTQRELKELVNAGMAFYYHNDPAGLARWLQDQLQ